MRGFVVRSAIVTRIVVGGAALVVLGCAAAGDGTADVGTVVAADGDTDPAPTVDPAASWPVEADRAAIRAEGERLTEAFAQGSRAGMTATAEGSWPTGFTADSILTCQFSEPTPTYAALDADGFSVETRIWFPVPDPEWRYPPTEEALAPLGLRVYRIALQEVVTTAVTTGWSSQTYEAHAAVTPDGRVVLFPECEEYLPGGRYAHRVNDGDVGGYSEDEARGDLALVFRELTDDVRASFCAGYDELGADGMRDGFVSEAGFPEELTVDIVREAFDAGCRGEDA